MNMSAKVIFEFYRNDKLFDIKNSFEGCFVISANVGDASLLSLFNDDKFWNWILKTIYYFWIL